MLQESEMIVKAVLGGSEELRKVKFSSLWEFFQLP